MTEPRAWPAIDGERYILSVAELDDYQRLVADPAVSNVTAMMAGKFIMAHCVAVLAADDLRGVWGNYCAGVKP